MVDHRPAEEYKVFPEIDVVWRGADVTLKPLYTFPDHQQECQILTRLTTEHFPTLKHLNESYPTGHGGSSGPCSNLTSFMMIEL